jgi:biopolymer transport protein TolQ
VVLAILLLFSVISWAVIFFKYRYLSKAEKQTRAFLRSLMARDEKSLPAHAKSLSLSPAANLYLAAMGERGSEGIRRALRRQEADEVEKLESYLGFLATTGSITPFIGLFGTVWGIMNSFRGIGLKGSASLAVVAPGIAEALIATAMGLAAAIPAVIAYNYFLGRTRRIIAEMEGQVGEIEAALKETGGEG